MLSRLLKLIAKAKWYLLVLALTIPTFTQLLRPGYFTMHDDISVLRVYEMELCFKSFQIPCRWIPDMGYQYGYPQFEYYGPLPYYVMTASRVFHLPLFDTIKLGFILPLILGNLAMFLLASTLFGNLGGLLATLAYGYAPFRASDIYSRGAMGETWAFIFLPLILYGLIKLYRKPNLKGSALLGLNLALLFVTHNISTLIFIPMVGLIAIVLLIYSKEKVKLAKYGLLSLVWGFFMAASFFLPVILEKGYAHTESLISGYFNYLAHFATLKQLFVSTFWAYGSSEIGPADDLAFFLGPIQLFLLAVSLTVLFINFMKRKLDFSAFILLASTFLLFVSLFMTHEKSTFIWKLIPVLSYLQFPWRFLVTANFFLCLSAGYFLQYLKSKTKLILLIVFGFMLFFMNISYFRPKDWLHLSIWEKFSGLSWDRQLTTSIFDYLPIYAKFPPATGAPRLPFADKSVSILDYQHQSSSLNFATKSNTSAVVTLPQYDFPGWQVQLDGHNLSHTHNNDLGLISFEVPAGDHKISAILRDTPVRLVGDLLTVIFLPLGIFILIKKEKNHD